MMSENNEKRVYTTIGAGRLLDIKVILDGQEVYNGKVEDAPNEIKKLKYSKIESGSKLTYYFFATCIEKFL